MPQPCGESKCSQIEDEKILSKTIERLRSDIQLGQNQILRGQETILQLLTQLTPSIDVGQAQGTKQPVHADTEEEGVEARCLPDGWPACLRSRREEAEDRVGVADFGDVSSALRQVKTVKSEGSDCCGELSYLRRLSGDSGLDEYPGEGSFEALPGGDRSRWTFLILPSSNFRLAFDVMGTLAVLYDLVFTPLALAWDLPFTGLYLSLAVVIAIFWTVDIVITLRTAIYKKGELVTDVRAIALNYAKSTLTFDLALVVVDWINLTLIWFEVAGATSGRLARLGKSIRIGRVARLLNVSRVTKAIEYIERFGDQMPMFGSEWRSFMDLIRLMVILLMINHLMACAWYWMSNVEELRDTGHSWVLDPLRVESDPTHADMSMAWQYGAAFHWSLTQMTPGSMPIVPRNSYERMYNIIALIFGTMFFSSLVSSLSATMVNIRMRNAQRDSLMKQLKKFLVEARVSTKVSMDIQRQASDRLSTPKPVTIGDVQALSYISESLREHLLLEVVSPLLHTHGFYRTLQTIDSHAHLKVLVEAISFKAYVPGEDVFAAGNMATAAYVVESGQLVYVQTPGSSKVQMKRTFHVQRACFLAEASLWCNWSHVGTLSAETATTLLALDSEKHWSRLLKCRRCKALTSEYSHIYTQKMVQLFPPEAAWPSDLPTHSLDFEEMIQHMSAEAKRFTSHFVCQLLQATANRWTLKNLQFDSAPRHKNLDFLAKEIAQRKSVLVIGKHWQFYRRVSVVALEAKDQEGRLLVCLGSWHPETGMRPCCLLPGGKQRQGQTLHAAIDELLSGKLLPVRELELPMAADASCDVFEQMSCEYNLQTTYFRQVCRVPVSHYDRSHVTSPTRVASRGMAWLQNDTADAEARYSYSVFTVPKSSGGLELYSWMPVEDFTRFTETHENQLELFIWLRGFHLDRNLQKEVEESRRTLHREQEMMSLAAVDDNLRFVDQAYLSVDEYESTTT